jgi:hypothetical protein
MPSLAGFPVALNAARPGDMVVAHTHAGDLFQIGLVAGVKPEAWLRFNFASRGQWTMRAEPRMDMNTSRMHFTPSLADILQRDFGISRLRNLEVLRPLNLAHPA